MDIDSSDVFKMIFKSLDDGKGQEIVCLEVSNLSSMIEIMIFVTGRSQRHIYSMAVKAGEELKHSLTLNTSVEGDKSSDWILLDAGDVVVNLMTEESRKFYSIEKLWLETGKKNIINIDEI